MVLGAMVLGAPRASNPLARSAKPGGGSIPLAPSRYSNSSAKRIRESGDPDEGSKKVPLIDRPFRKAVKEITAIVMEESMQEAIILKKLPDDVGEYLSKFNLNLCFTCGTCANGCPITGNPNMRGWDTRKVIRMLAFGMLEEVVNSKFPWLCTGCGRCANASPMGIDIVAIMGHMKLLRPRDQVPGILHKGVENVLKTGNNMAIPQADYFFLMADTLVLEPWSEEEVTRAEEEAAAQWEGLGVDLDAMEF